ncbi:carboxypeptidase-like regulatory domain-containing protein [Blastopirellula sp. J2-11]|uniref:carboxypeptidase-like regulatory domain-containing protein n=1 Tax=Blastopirellula sp. J2-11 TaxID=2943192 RepID=UPI0021C87C38|nr:carboxypeptidase-like regulatory domain-containing protein [Blastopirellula sp. J2-11]UUO08613.1 carboxypeptidase-like regulatory domain-containing protein [Blastopirellula sp. J2-11]
MKCNPRNFLISLTILLLMGCTGGTLQEGAAKTTVWVTLDDDPVEAAAVVFTPASQGRSASGMTDENGRCEMGTSNYGDGVFPGVYQVTVSKSIDDPDSVAEVSEEYDGRGIPPSAKQIYLVPKKYISPTTSGLTVTVQEGKENKVELELHSK